MSFNRRSATKVKDGRVQRKNRRRPTAHDGYVIDRESPGRGCIHVVSKRDVQAFIDLIPEWPRYAEKLSRIILASYEDACYGRCTFRYRDEIGKIYLFAWPEDLSLDYAGFRYFDLHEPFFQRLGVSYVREEDGVVCRFTEAQARAFMLLHVFLHELGHHYDFTHRKHHRVGPGEEYAERFATSRFEQLLPVYVSVFGDPRLSA